MYNKIAGVFIINNDTKTKLEERGKKMQEFGDKMGKVGKQLTLGLTLPMLVGFVFLGVFGAVLGMVVGALIVYGMWTKEEE